MVDVPLWSISFKELSSDCGPNEKDDPMECLGRETEGEGKFGIPGIAKPTCGGGVEVMLNIEYVVSDNLLARNKGWWSWTFYLCCRRAGQRGNI